MSSRGARQTGLSLVELLVSMVIGLTVVGAALSMYISSGYSSRGGSALSQMTEDASIALSLLRSQVAMAGYSTPKGVNPTDGSMVKRYTGNDAVFGCSGGPTEATRGATLAAMICNDKVTTPDSIVVSYEADTINTVPDTSTLPTDCIGTKLKLDTTATDPYYLAQNRYFVDDSSLKCLGNGGGGAQPLVDNIVDMKISYGVAKTVTTAGVTKTDNVAVRYMTAQQISGTEGYAAALWKQVTSARICIVVQSDTQVLDEVTDYFDCTGTAQTPPDKRMYRAFTTTVVLQNRIL